MGLHLGDNSSDYNLMLIQSNESECCTHSKFNFMQSLVLIKLRRLVLNAIIAKYIIRH